jgi:pimeloyl-ACP methyl ester carboxylesterase
MTTMAAPDALQPLRALDARARHATTPCGTGVVRWRSWGAGRPLVILHGGFGSWQHWVHNIDTLSQHFEVIACDLPGLGDSDEAPKPHTAETIAAILHVGIDEIVGVDARLALAGFSLGGAIAAVLGERLKLRLDHLFLFAPSALGAFWRPINERAVRWPPDASEEERLATVRTNLAISMIADPARIDDLAVLLQDKLVRQKRRLKGLPISTSDVALRALRAIEEKTTIVWGERDPYLHPSVSACAEHVRASHPRIRTDIYPGIGHWVIFEAAETVNSRIIRTLGRSA